MEFSFAGVFAVALIALLAPLLVRLAPKLRIPAVALEILLGILVGPSVLGIVGMDAPLNVFGQTGLAFLLFLAGLEIDLGSLRGRLPHITGAWGLSFLLALAGAYVIFFVDAHDGTLIVAIAISSTSLGLVVPILREAGETRSDFGQIVLASSSVAEFASLLALSIFFSTTGDDPKTQLFLLGVFVAMAGAMALTIARVGSRTQLLPTLDALADGASQIRVRFIMVILFAFVAVASKLGFEAILGSFCAGVLLRFLDTDERLEEQKLKYKIDAIGYGFLVPFFFVTSGIKIDVAALFASPKHLLLIPALVLAMLVARGVPSLLLRNDFGVRRARAAALLFATNLSFMVIVADVGQELGKLDEPSAAAMVLAGVVSVLLFPPIAVAFLPGDELVPDWDEQGIS